MNHPFNLITISSLLKQWPVVTRKLLVVRPKFLKDSYCSNFTIPASKQLIKAAGKLQWDINVLTGNDTNRANVENEIKTYSPDFIVHYDHGSWSGLRGQDSNQKIYALDMNNVGVLKGHAVSTVSCNSAGGFGPSAIGGGARAYLGYGSIVYVYYKYAAKYIDAANAANIALLEGKTFGQAWQIGYDTYTKHYQDLLANNSLAAAAMLTSRNGLKRLGDTRVVARPIGIVLNV